MFDTILLLAIAAFAVACVSTVCSIVLRAAERRRNSVIASLPTVRVPESSWRPAFMRRERGDERAEAPTVSLRAVLRRDIIAVPERNTIGDNFGEF